MLKSQCNHLSLYTWGIYKIWESIKTWESKKVLGLFLKIICLSAQFVLTLIGSDIIRDFAIEFVKNTMERLGMHRMRTYMMIALGGMLGAVLRTMMQRLQPWDPLFGVPYQTVFINVCGSLLLTFFLTLALEALEIDPDVRLGLTAGFLASFTTFSAICRETALLMITDRYLTALFYLTATVVLGLSAAWLGVRLARKAMRWVPSLNKGQKDGDF